MKNGMKREDKLVSDIMKDFTMESPSDGFTDRVMQNIQLERNISPISSGSLIGTWGWIGIAAGILVLFLLVFLGGSIEPSSGTGGLIQRFSSIQPPSIDFQFKSVLSWINLSSPTLLWIFTGIGGIILLSFLERLINGIRVWYSYDM